MRRLSTAGLLIAFALLLVAAGPCATPSPPVPDVNDDGVVNVLDAAAVWACLPTPSVTAAPACASADTDGDGDVDGADLDVVVQHFGIRVRLDGNLFAVGAGRDAPFADLEAQLPVPLPVEDGTFSWHSASPDADLGDAPGTLTWQVPGGSLAATLVRRNAPRRIDLTSGRPIRGDAPVGAACVTGAEPDCWTLGAPESANPSSFDALCIEAAIPLLDPAACSLDFYGSEVTPEADTASGFFPLHVAGIFTLIASGQNAASAVAPVAGFINGNLVLSAIGGYTLQTSAAIGLNAPFAQTYGIGPTPTMLVPLVVDALDGLPAMFTDLPAVLQAELINHGDAGAASALLPTGVSGFQSEAQEASFGCGPFYGPSCDVAGFDLFHSEAGVVLDAVVGQDPLRCGRADPTGSWVLLPGCRGPADPGYDLLVDGTTAGQLHPVTGIPFADEVAIASWNFSQWLAAGSSNFDPDDPFPSVGCDLSRPNTCSEAVALLSHTARVLPGELDGAPELRWLWELGAEYVVTSATGTLAPYLGYGLHALGPAQARSQAPTSATGIGFVLRAPPAAAIPAGAPFLVRYAGLDFIVGSADDPFRGVAYGLVN